MDIQDEFIKTIDERIRMAIDDMQFDKTYYGKIVSINNKTCVVNVNDNEYSAKIKDGIIVDVDDVVVIKAPNGSFSYLYVDGKLGNVSDVNTILSELNAKINNKADKDYVDGVVDNSWDGITGKPLQFPPSSHGHAWGDVTGKPTSLPANGGNADTVQGINAYYQGTFNASGGQHPNNQWLLYCKHNAFGDNRFALLVDGNETRVHQATNADNAGNSASSNCMNVLARDGHFLYAERFNGWQTRLKMGYANGDVKSQEVFVHSADYATSAGDQGNFQNRLRNIYLSTNNPSGGVHGEVWMKYS